jgi:GSH-dependent disulfide-bond oxidoreductase
MSHHPIELHYWPTPNGWKISIALEEMGLTYDVHWVNIGKGEQFRPEFLAISPNNRMPAIVDPDGPGGAPISIFESGAILQYLGRKTGKLYPKDERGRVNVDQWVMWQMANLGPVMGQRNHFKNYAKAIVQDPAQLSYAITRFGNEANRLFGVIERQLAKHAFIASDEYTIADIASWSWLGAAYDGGELDEFSHLKIWFEKIKARPAVQKGRALGAEKRVELGAKDAAAQRAILFGQTAGSVAAAAEKAKP